MDKNTTITHGSKLISIYKSNYLVKKRSDERHKEWWNKNRKNWSDYLRSYKTKKKNEVVEALGGKCKVCGITQEMLYETKSTQQRWLHCHEINGEKHKGSVVYYLNNLDKFVLLCPSCHRGVHFVERFLRLSWKELEPMIIQESGKCPYYPI